MPIRTPDRIVRVSCPRCAWHLIVNRGGVGDCLVGANAWRFAVNQVGDRCPKCGSDDLTESPASTWEKINPLEYLRKLNHAFFLGKMRGK